MAFMLVLLGEPRPQDARPRSRGGFGSSPEYATGVKLDERECGVLCPACNQPLVALELEGVEIDYCVACHGIWLDAGELEQIAELAGVPAGPLSAALQADQVGTRGKRRCPRCRRRLTAVSVASDPAVEIDRCPREHGVWLDQGELRVLIASFAEGEGGAVATFFANLLRHELDTDSRGE